MHHHTGPVTGFMVWGDIRFLFCALLVRFDGRLRCSLHYISKVLEPVVLPYIQRLLSSIFQQDNARPQRPRNVQDFYFTQGIELLPWPTCHHDLTPVENVCSMLAQPLARDTKPAATPDQFWQYAEASWTVVLQGYVQILLASMPRRMA
ncbi:transposable element Tcb1 transposase [Trichonephila clavipes]|nr:transposable element Tcb1 transposase [Trichonephila clavipes]